MHTMPIGTIYTNHSLAPIELPGADLRFAPEWLLAAEADALFAQLRQHIPWECHRIRMFGREVDSPRLSCWIGDPEAVYTYSRTRFAPHPWPVCLQLLRERLADALGVAFNSVLANLYRDGRDRMGWHSDDEPDRLDQPGRDSTVLPETEGRRDLPTSGSAARQPAGDGRRHADGLASCPRGYGTAGGCADQSDFPAHPRAGKPLIRKE
jgi:hypothetical protein